MLLLLASLALGAPTTDAIDETAESLPAAGDSCFVGGPYTMTSLEAEATYAFTLTTEEFANLENIEIQLRAHRRNCLVEIDEFEIYVDSKSIYKDATIAISSEGDGDVGSAAWRVDETYVVSDIVDEVVSPGDHEIRAVARGSGDNDNTKIEITITADWIHGDDWDSDGYSDDRLTGGDDCNDDVAAINPGAEEIWYDAIDQDCDGRSDFDQDFDGFDSSAELDGGTDCDDLNDDINENAEEIWYDGVDQDCDAWSDYDQDRDSFDSSAELGEGTDCDDLDPAINTDAVETWYDGVDQDCDGWSDFDQDRDSFDRTEDGGTDCDDLDPAVNVDATEVWYDGVDQDCDGWSDYDQDRDGFDSPDHGGNDCADDDADAFPGARTWTEDCQKTIKDDGSRDAPSTPEAVATGCDCDSTGGAGSWAWMGLGVLLLVGRRRR